ncbi:MAG: dTDP-4-dehydrorhamnose reductase [Pseudomonadota bacterium]|nr:dTDP-4-dehydrorhamnose reductase [Pseudomonadota bacterium]
MKILVTGKNGQLGKSIHKFVTNNEQNSEFVFVGREELDLSNQDSITNYFNNKNFDVIINCAAYTDVDKAEKEIELANYINHLAISKIAEISKKNKVKLIHISTDYIFDGKSKKAYLESDDPSPLNIYGKSKLAGEIAVCESMQKNAIIIRTSWLYSEYSNNFFNKIIGRAQKFDELSVVSDQFSSPTNADDLAKVITQILNHNKFRNHDQLTQIYHYSSYGLCSWFEFAREILELVNINCQVNPIETKDYLTAARRPKYSLLNTDKIVKDFGLEIPYWKDSLKASIDNLL